LENAWEYNGDIYLILVDFQIAYESIWRQKWYEIIKFFAIPNKLIRLIKVTKNDFTYHVKMIADGFKVGNGLKQGDGLAPNLFNIALE
jgi:hypothetical protein